MKNKKKNNLVDFIVYCSLLISIYLYYKFGLNVAIIGLIIQITIITAYGIIKKNRIKNRYLNSGIYEVDRMTGLQFESFLLAHFEQLGYKGKTTKATNDYGADLLLKRDNETIVIQAKRWKGQIGIKAVQEVVGAVNYCKVTISNNHSLICIVKGAKNLALAANIELWDRNKLILIMSQASGKVIADKVIKKSSELENSKCPTCGGILKERNGQRGKFLGCSNFPKCRYIQKIFKPQTMRFFFFQYSF